MYDVAVIILVCEEVDVEKTQPDNEKSNQMN